MPPRKPQYVKRTVTRKSTVSIRPKTFALERSQYAGVISSAGSTAIRAYGVSEFKLNSLPNHTEFTNLFDQYRIIKVVVQCLPRVTQVFQNASAAPVNVFTCAVDQTDVTTPISESDVLQYDNHKTLQALRPLI